MSNTFDHGALLISFADVSAPPLRHADLVGWFSRRASICRVIPLWSGIALGLIGLLFEIVRETTEFVGNVRRTQSNVAQRNSRIAEKRW